MKKTIYPLAFIFLLAACGKESDFVVREAPNDLSDIQAMETNLNIPTWGLLSYDRVLPAYLRALGMKAPKANDLKATLGRVLFYDKNLSLDRSTACASCHRQSLAFSDDVAFSTGIKGLQGSRNALPIANVASFSAHYTSIAGFQPMLLWDNRAANVPEQAKMAFLNGHEMGMTMAEVVERVKEQPYYAYLWKKTYESFNVTEDQVFECLTEFVGAMGSHQSRFDHALEKAKGDLGIAQFDTTVSVVISHLYYGIDTITTLNITNNLPGLTERETAGRDIFVKHCTKCHSPVRPLQEVFEACNGLDEEYADQGIGARSGNPVDNGVFKVPSLRNIALTAPYMHDGRFKTLEEVIGFYNSGVQNHPNLHPLLKRNGATNLNLTHQQRRDLKAFLLTLTDNTVASDERFSDPFK